MILQATINGALSADYTIVVLVAAVGFMLLSFGSLVSWAAIRSLKQIEVQIKSMGERIDQIVDDHIELEKQVITMRAKMPDPELLASQIVLKLRAITEIRNL